MPRKYLLVLMFSFLSVIAFISFAAAASAQEEEARYVAKFNYTPDTQAAPGSAGVTFAVADVSYQQVGAKDIKPWFTYSQFDNLQRRLGKI
ncbi:MAG: hypothetical protein AABY55_05100 [Candidatus Omnitrophota bacterium]